MTEGSFTVGTVTSAQYSISDLSPALSLVTFCVIDIETAGRSAAEGGITEIGAVKYCGGQEIDRFNTLINPQMSIPPFIVVLTGITDAMVRHAPTVETVLPSLIDFIGDSVIVAHNARFDMGFINAALDTHGYDTLANKVVDTVTLARRLVRHEVPNCKLSTLASHLGLAHQPIHRAIDDVLATGDLLHYLIERASSFGVNYLDDLLSLPSISHHPQAKKLSFTDQLPRTPGVYLFADKDGHILYAGKATNLRQRVRSYFGTSDSRKKVGALLKHMTSVHYIETPDPVTAEILESRIIASQRPRYNRAGTRSEKYCYVRLTTDEEWPRLMVATTAPTSGICIGPVSGRSMARDIIDAIESVVPLRRCTVRMGRNYKPCADAEVCSAARLGLAYCPCSGTADKDTYTGVVRVVADTLLGYSQEVIQLLNIKMKNHSEAQRFEEAAYIRDRVLTIENALRRQHRVDTLCVRGDFTITSGNIEYEISHGLLTETRIANQLFTPLTVSTHNVDGSSHMPKLSKDLSAIIAAPLSTYTENGFIRTTVIDEIMCVVRLSESVNSQ